jgi:uncharacterized membrane protein
MGMGALFRGRRKWIAAAAAVVVVGGIAALAGGHHHHCSPEARADWATRVAARKLDLDDSQRAAFRKVADAYVSVAADDRSFAQTVVREARDAVGAANVSAAQVTGIATQVKAEFDRRIDAVTPALVAFHATLNGDQRAKLAGRLDRILRRLAD